MAKRKIISEKKVILVDDEEFTVKVTYIPMPGYKDYGKHIIVVEQDDCPIYANNIMRSRMTIEEAIVIIEKFCREE